MNTEDKKLDARTSLCWNCKFGLCVQETEQERVLHNVPPGFMPESGDPFGEMQDSEESVDMIEHILEHERVKTICFWKPANITQAPPIVVALVTKCSRFEFEQK